jgi:hypothetical protein
MEVIRRLHLSIRFIEPGAIAVGPVPQGLSVANASVGLAAAEAFIGRRIDFAATLATIHLPGRLTHVIDREQREWLVDAAINVRGIATAMSHWDAIDFVLVSIPDSKDVNGIAAWLDAHIGSRKWIPVVPALADHLSYSAERWGRPLVQWRDACAYLAGSRRIVAVGSWSFMSSVLGYLGIDNERAFTSP